MVGEKTESMKTRVRRTIPMFLQSPKIFTLLGGTNDVIIVPPEKSLQNLLDMIEQMLEVPGAKVVLLTIPDHPSEKRIPKVRQRRMLVNKELRRKFGEENQYDGRVLLVDIAKYIPQYVIESDDSPSNPHPIHLEMWDPDRLHFSPEGYDYIAEVIFNHLNTARWI